MPKLIPAILEKTEEEVFKKIAILKGLGLDTAHLDVMDGLAVPNICWSDLKAASKLDINLEVHLMVREPLKEALKWLALKNVTRVIVRGEEIYDWQRFSAISSDYGNLGIAFDPTTLFYTKLEKLSHLSFFLIMGVRSGFSGQKFNALALGNIAIVKYLYPSTSIGIDGGMNEITIPMAKQFGVDSINTASYFWNSPEKRKIIRLIEEE